MEDLLTSVVFGSFDYVRAEDGLLPFLRLAQDVHGGKPFKQELPDGTQATLEFWPWITESGAKPCEPDILIELAVPGRQPLLVLVEAKFRSPKSSEADPESECPNDQLARECDNLVRRVRPNQTPVLIYLTTDVDVPVGEIEDSIKEYVDDYGKSPPAMLWLSWRHMWVVTSASGNPVLRDLRAMLERLYLYVFHGVELPDTGGLRQWQYNKWQWVRSCDQRLTWRYNSE
jgi:hypothetical protein